MKIFISHNKADKPYARSLATAFVQRGIDVWFDEWQMRPGDSIIGGIERGLSDADIFVLVWSVRAAESNWVGTEVRAYLRRRVDDGELRIVPVMMDETPLPTLVAEYLGFSGPDVTDVERVAERITGSPADREVARLLQNRLHELTAANSSPGDPNPYLICPECGSGRLRRFTETDYAHDRLYYCIECEECKWSDGTE
jgi:hypothetical protein